MNSSICSLINKYIHIGRLTDKRICRRGLICKIKHVKNINLCFGHSCFYGNIKIVNMMIDRGANDWNGGLNGACEGGHLELVKIILSKNNRACTWWDYSLYKACIGGNIHIVKLMINPEITGDNGARDWNWGLYGACKFNHQNVAELMINPSLMVGISKGADRCDYCHNTKHKF